MWFKIGLFAGIIYTILHIVLFFFNKFYREKLAEVSDEEGLGLYDTYHNIDIEEDNLFHVIIITVFTTMSLIINGLLLTIISSLLGYFNILIFFISIFLFIKKQLITKQKQNNEKF